MLELGTGRGKDEVRDKTLADSEDTEITLGTGKLLGIFFGLVFLCAIFDANRRAHHCTKPHARPAWRHKTSHFRPA